MRHTVVLQTGLGRVDLRWSGGRLEGIRLGRLERDGGRPGRPYVAEGRPPDGMGEALVGELMGYFSGRSITPGEGLPLPVATPFQRAVWRAAREIPYGQTRSYGWVAEAVGRRGAARAVGAALGKNPFPMVVPCHRVVGAGGALTGFAYGKAWKAALLALEGMRIAK